MERKRRQRRKQDGGRDIVEKKGKRKTGKEKIGKTVKRKGKK